MTGQETQRSAQSANRRDAERKAALWEDDLNRLGAEPVGADMDWGSFTAKYQVEHLESLSPASYKRALGTVREFGRLIAPRSVGSVTTEHLTAYATKLRARGSAETTIATDLGRISAALNWARHLGILHTVPNLPKIHRAKRGSRSKLMKGRPISEIEFQALLGAAGSVVGDRAPEWERILRGLWLSGLRVAEAFHLRWASSDWDGADCLMADLSGRRPVFRVPAAAEKGFRDRVLPITPDFAEFLEQTPAPERFGLVFPLTRLRNRGTATAEWVSKTISEIGKAAGIVVDPRGPKYVSAHDLRRSFGTRWSALVMPQILRDLMRHESIETTMKFYVGREAEQTADLVFSAWENRPAQQRGDTSGDTKTSHSRKAARKHQKT